MARRKVKAEGSVSSVPPAGATPPADAVPAEPVAQSPAKRASAAPAATGRVLCVDGSASSLKRIRTAAAALTARVDTAAGIVAAREALAKDNYDVAVLDTAQNDAEALQLVRELSACPSCACRFIITSSRSDLDAAVDAMRSGAADFLATPFTQEDITIRLRAALEQSRAVRDSNRRVERLQRICKRLNTAREEVSDQVDSLCTDLVSAYEELADQMSTATLATEFNALVRQELDVESLLRTTLEFMLTRTGPTNAAVFLPTGGHDYNLGAYVNYDIPRDTADVLLDHLADFMPQRFEELESVLVLATPEAQESRLGDEASWIVDSTMAIFACRDDDECLAVVALFRDRKHAFSEELVGQLEVMRDIFAEQLARVVRIHHRAVANPEWPGFDVEDDRGMAA